MFTKGYDAVFVNLFNSYHIIVASQENIDNYRNEWEMLFLGERTGLIASLSEHVFSARLFELLNCSGERRKFDFQVREQTRELLRLGERKERGEEGAGKLKVDL